MARCGCAGGTCSCVVQGVGTISVTGAGSPSNPYLISGGSEFQVTDTATVDLTLTGTGADTEPYILTANAILELDELTDVSTAGATTGQVLARQSDGTYRFVAPTTASPGAITVGQDLQGDGSGGNPLRAKLVAGGGLVTSASGLSVQGTGAWTAYTPAFTASTSNPSVGNGSLTGRYNRLGKMVFFTIRLTIGSTTTRGVGTWRFSLPTVPAAPTLYSAYVSTNGNGVYAGVGASNGSAARVDAIYLSTSLRAEALSHSVPAAFDGGGVVWITGMYEEV